MRWRLLGSFLLVILIALGTVWVVTRYTTEQEVQTFLGHGGQVGLENLADNLESYYADNGSWAGVATDLRSGQGRGQGPRAGANALGGDHILTDASGVVLISPISAEVGDRLSDDQLRSAIPLSAAGEVVGYLIPEGGIPVLPDNFEELLIERVNRASMLAALISGGIAIVLALILAAVILRPIREMTRAAQKMSEGDLSQRVNIQGGGELGTLGGTFNQMAYSLQDAEVRRMAMTADIAHELRNPLAIQRAHLEAMQDGILPTSQENLALISEQNQQLTRLVEDLRMLALAESGELTLNRRMVDLSELCRETIHRFEPQANSKRINIFGGCGDQPLIAYADKERLQQIHDNVMQNAMRYTPEGGWINLSLSREGKKAIFRFHNNGPQIDEKALPHLFERFYRADKARDRASGGTGLGLAIARKLAETHGGSLTAENHPSEGVVFKLTLPL
jgi:two-component system OmpR family sensor kinase/two-component system sensor histidine kinase BaeS